MNIVYISMGIVLLWISGSLYRRRKNRNKVICVLENNCTGCGRCVRRCSRRALVMTGNGEAVRAALKYPEKCTACGDCLGKCRYNALKLAERK
jgi:ferredoxin